MAVDAHNLPKILIVELAERGKRKSYTSALTRIRHVIDHDRHPMTSASILQGTRHLRTNNQNPCLSGNLPLLK